MLKSKKLKLSYDGGMVDGRARTLSKTYSNISPEASDVAVYDAAQILVGLQTRPVKEVLKIEETILEEQVPAI